MTKHNYFFACEQDIWAYFEENMPSGVQTLYAMNSTRRQRLFDYMCGKKTLPLTYDPFFKLVFDFEKHPERLSDFISAVLEKPVQVIETLPTESILFDGYTVIIMDMLVRLNDGSLANVEIQKYASGFSDERISCYSADLLLREYNRVKRSDDKVMHYKDVKSVHSIILFEQSKAAYKAPNLRGAYLHHGEVTFDTGLKLNLLQQFHIVALDVFLEQKYNILNTRLNGWLSLLTIENMSDVDTVIQNYPWLAEIYAELSGYMVNPKEVLNMYSDALKILDANEMKLFVDNVLDAYQQALEESREKDATIAEKDASIAEKDAEIQHLKSLLEASTQNK